MIHYIMINVNNQIKLNKLKKTFTKYQNEI